MRSSRFARFDRRLATPPDPGRVAFLLARDVAHRGLHGGSVPENGFAAADAAIAQGLAIECDVRLSHGGVPIVFHDADTMRLCGRGGRLEDVDVATLQLADGSPVPTLAGLLDRIAGRVPLLIEIKTDTRIHAPLCRAVLRTIHGRGPLAIMGFNPEVPRWFARHAPDVVRGLVMTERGGWRDSVERRLAVWRSHADFLAYDVRHLPSPLPAALRAAGLPVLTWTVRTPADHAVAADHADRPILERP